MGKKKAKPIPFKKPRDPEQSRRVRRIVRHVIGAVVCIVALCGGLHALRNYVEQRVVFPDAPPKVVLVNRPAWMSDFLADQIESLARPIGTHSTFDRQMLVDAAKMLEGSPWIRQVKQIRRAYGNKPGDTLEIDCEYRAPIALVHWKDYFWLVDGEGVKLPEQFTADQVPRIIQGRDKKMNIRVIEGVDRPPPESGQKWIGDDLAAGLDMVRLLFGRPYAEEIVKVDVANFSGRRDPREAQVVLVTKYNTEVRWGRPANAEDYFIEVSTAQKLDYLRQIYEQFHRVDGHRAWIDIRFDKITYPSVDPVEAEHASGR
jgi:hypothetical protein